MSKASRPLIRYVYVIGPTSGLQKIGIATDPQVRLSALQTASPLTLLIHAAIPVPFREAHAIERAAHKALASCCVRGEWFETTPAQAIVAAHNAAKPFIGQATPVPDPKVIWPSVASWRADRDRGLPLFDYSREHAQQPTPVGWWSKLRRSLQP